MKNKGFTLTELLAVLVIMSVLALIIVPIILRIQNNNTDNMYDKVLDNIIIAAKAYMGDHPDELPTIDGDTTYVWLGLIIDSGYIENTVTVDGQEQVLDPRTNSPISRNLNIEVKRLSRGVFDYNIDDSGEISSTLESCFNFSESTNTINGFATSLPSECNAYINGNKLFRFPETINGVQVKYIKSLGGKGIKGKIYLPSGLVEVSSYSFYNSDATTTPNEITEVFLPNSVTKIGEFAFSKVTTLRNINLPNDITSIGKYAFRGTTIRNFTLPLELKTIGEFAFHDVAFGGSLVIPNKVETIERYAFVRTAISSLTLGSSLKIIGGYAFAGNNLTTVTIPASVETIDNYAFNTNSFTSVNILGNQTRFNSTWTLLGFPAGLMPS